MPAELNARLIFGNHCVRERLRLDAGRCCNALAQRHQDFGQRPTGQQLVV
jgi:hypothetical protein